MVAGQQLDLDAEGQELRAEDVKKIHQNKTGALILASALTGAIIVEAGDNELRAVENYAAKLGLLFQITDDFIDVTQPTEVLGKTAGKDVLAEKATYPSMYGLAATKDMATSVHRDACESLKSIQKPTQVLREIADFILTRYS
jgi:geranylgeranyl pyrophosphate synthase